METTSYNPGDRIKIRRPRLGEKRAKVVTVKYVKDDGTIIAQQATRMARGGGWTLMDTPVRPNEVIGKEDN